MTRYVYMLSFYQEDGAENAVATLQRDRLPELLELYMKLLGKETPQEYRDKLANFSKKTMPNLPCHSARKTSGAMAIALAAAGADANFTSSR